MKWRIVNRHKQSISANGGNGKENDAQVISWEEFDLRMSKFRKMYPGDLEMSGVYDNLSYDVYIRKPKVMGMKCP